MSYMFSLKIHCELSRYMYSSMRVANKLSEHCKYFNCANGAFFYTGGCDYVKNVLLIGLDQHSSYKRFSWLQIMLRIR